MKKNHDSDKFTLVSKSFWNGKFIPWNSESAYRDLTGENSTGYRETGLFVAAISAPPVSLWAISAPDYFVAKQFRRRRHQIFHKIFFIIYIHNIIVLFKKAF